VDAFDVLTALGALEMVLADLGQPARYGAAVGAASQVLSQ
jgi:aspartate aminotransferase-like enzyme